MDLIITFALGIATLTLATVQLIKTSTNVNKQYMPIIALLIGVLIGGIAYAIPELQADLSIGAHLLGGALTGLSAVGLFELITIKGDK